MFVLMLTTAKVWQLKKKVNVNNKKTCKWLGSNKIDCKKKKPAFWTVENI